MGKKQRAKLTRRKAISLYRKYRAIRILTNNLSPEQRKKSDSILERLQQRETGNIMAHLSDLEKETKELCKKYGVIGSLKDLEDVANIKPEDDNPLIFVAKFDLEKLFAHYERRVPKFSTLPPHARIGIERYGTDKKEEIEFFMLEASLFEDMAALWNSALELHQSLRADYRKEKKKRLSALLRATAKSVFNLIEGHLNSLALDILVSQTVTDKDRSLLTEWDSTNSKPKFLTLRDKLLQYPKIAIGAHEPPLTEGNCPEIGKIVDLETRQRHSLIHPSPQASMKNASLHRERIYLNLQIDDVADLCDTTINLIRRLDEVIGRKYGGVDSWLIKRDTTGFFPNSVFT